MTPSSWSDRLSPGRHCPIRHCPATVPPPSRQPPATAARAPSEPAAPTALPAAVSSAAVSPAPERPGRVSQPAVAGRRGGVAASAPLHRDASAARGRETAALRGDDARAAAARAHPRGRARDAWQHLSAHALALPRRPARGARPPQRRHSCRAPDHPWDVFQLLRPSITTATIAVYSGCSIAARRCPPQRPQA